jgi:hypothetical protein
MDIHDLEAEVLDPLEQAMQGGLVGVLDPEQGRATDYRHLQICEGLLN